MLTGISSSRRIAFTSFVTFLILLVLSSPLVAKPPAGASTATTVSPSQATITLGDTVTFTATVTTASGTPTGLVTFFDGATPLGSGVLQLVNGNDQATFSSALLSASASPHSITAVYQGDANFSGSTSSPTSETVNPRTSTSGVVLNPTTVFVGQPSTATVTVTDSGSVPPGTADSFSPTGAPATGRAGFTSTLFADGLVLVAGGSGANGTTVLSSAEIYSVSGAAFSTTGNLNTARTGAVAVLLPTGKVLVAGGSSDGTPNGALNTAELFDPSAGTFSVAGSGSNNTMTAARFGATATLLNNGQVLLAGGENSGGVLNSAELYNPATDTFTPTGNLNIARTGAAAVLLGPGQVLIAGGSSDGTANGALNTAEFFDPNGNGGAGAFTAISSTLSAPRWQPEAALLLSGNALLAGGQDSVGVLTSADLYNPVTNTFTASTQQMAQARSAGSAVSLPNGMVLLAGGTASQIVDLYDGDSDRFDATGSLQQSDNGLVSTLLNNGQVLAVGLTNGGTPASDAELYSPSFNPLGTIGLSSSAATDLFGTPCVLTPSTGTASTCASTVTPVNVATSPHVITGAYPADAVHSGSSSTANLNVTPASTTTTVTSSSNPSVFGQLVTFTVTVSDSSAGSTAQPTGSVQFVVDGVNFGSPVALGGGAGNFSTATSQATATLSVAGSPHTVTANYVNADGNFTNSSGSLSGGQIVAAANSATTVTSSPNPSAFGQPVTFFVTVSPVAPGAGTPTGTVAFLDGLTPIGSGILAGGATSFTTSSLAPGSHTITANYSGDGNFNTSSGSAAQVVVGPPAIAKGFTPVGIQPNGVSTLTITITNPAANTVAENGVAFTDSLPTNVVVATPNGLSNSCGGTAVATSGTGTVSLTGGTIAVNSSCAVSVNVTSAFTGSYLNTTGNVSSTNGGAGGAATATLYVANPPTISKLFLPNTVAQNGATLLSFTIENPNSNSIPPNSDVTLSGITFTDVLPAGLQVASPNNLSNDCNGTVTANPGSTSITLTGGTIGPAVGLISRRNNRVYRKNAQDQAIANGACFVSVEVTPTVTGTLNNTTGPISANESGQGATSNTASLTVTPGPTVAAPTLVKAFGAPVIALGQSTSLTFTVANPNPPTATEVGNLVNIAFNDVLPAGLIVASPNGLSGGCVTNNGAAIAANPGAGTVILFSLNLAESASCAFTVNVMAATGGIKNNVTGNITATFDTGGGNFQLVTGGAASASLLVTTPVMAITKTHVGDFSRGSTGATYTITVSNVGTGQTVGAVSVTDTLPDVNNTLVATNIAGSGWTCTLATLTCTRSDALVAPASYPAIILTVNVPQNIRANVTNAATVSGGGDPNNHTAYDPTHIGPPVQMSTNAAGVTVNAGGTQFITLDVESHAGEGMLSLACSGLPSGTSCSFNPPTTNQLSTSVSLGITVAPGSSAVLPLDTGKRPPLLYAALLPLLGLAGLLVGARRNRAWRLRGAMLLAGLAVALAFMGCGGGNMSTPTRPQSQSTFQVTVTATSATTGHSGSAVISVTVTGP